MQKGLLGEEPQQAATHNSLHREAAYSTRRSDQTFSTLRIHSPIHIGPWHLGHGQDHLQTQAHTQHGASPSKLLKHYKGLLPLVLALPKSSSSPNLWPKIFSNKLSPTVRRKQLWLPQASDNLVNFNPCLLLYYHQKYTD